MSIQQNAPATIFFRFRHYDENGKDLGGLDLSGVDFRPLRIIFRRPDKTRLEILEDEITIVDAAAGEVEYLFAAGELALHGKWQAQAWAGEWPSSVITFSVSGPNI